MITPPVQHAEDDDATVFDPVKNLAGEAPQEHAPEATLVKRRSLRVGREQFHDLGHLVKKVLTQSGHLFLIPIAGFRQIRFSAG